MEDIKFENNRYVVKLPFKENIPFVSNNYNVSLNRLSKLKNRLSKSTDTLAKYDKVITDQLEHGIIEKVESIGIPGNIKYLPHQAVIRDDHSSIKLREVLKTIGPSLNGTLYKGPCLTPLLFDVLLRFRFNPIGIIAYIEKAYLQISVADCHLDFLRFLWFIKDIPEVTTYRFYHDIFGANWSQYLLNSVIRFHPSKYKNASKEFSEQVAKSFYVDEFNFTAKDFSEGIEIYKKIKLRFLDASFNVCKWKTNNPDLQNYFNKMENQFSPTSEIQGNNKVKVLEIVWDTKSDHLVFSFENLIESFNNIIPTKRNILSLIAKFYDPIGLIQPIIIKLKLLFQEVGVTHADWDLEITGQLKDKFDFFVKFVKTLTAVQVSRCCFYDIMPRDYIVSYELYGFSDSS